LSFNATSALSFHAFRSKHDISCIAARTCVEQPPKFLD